MSTLPPFSVMSAALGLPSMGPGHATRLVFAFGLALVLALSLVTQVHADEAAEVRALMARGDLAGALKPHDEKARFLLGVVLMDMQRDTQALALFASMAQEYPELPDPHNNMALLHARAGRLEPARQALEIALRNDPTHRAARANLGQIHLMLAVQAWEMAASAGPIDPPLQRKLEGARALLASPTLAAR
jgi:Flp pilus assembly protein TadD